MKKIRLLSTLLFSTMISANTMSANVSEVSGESFQQSGKDAFWVVSVSCDDNDAERIVRRNADADTWCPKGGEENLCSEDKSIAAKNACSSAYQSQSIALAAEQAEKKRRQTAASEAAAREKEAAERAIQEAELALQAKISLEEALLAIEQERLELSQRELEIDRRIIEINEILSTEDDI